MYKKIDLDNNIVDIIVNETINKHIDRFRPYMDKGEMIAKGVIKEGLIRTYPKTFVINYIKKHYSHDLSYFILVNQQMIMSLPKNHESVNLISKDMDAFGWYCAAKVEDESIDDNIKIVFEPKYQDTYTSKEVHEVYDYLIHVTPECNINKILKNGFIPKSTNSLFSYPGRIYFWGCDIDGEELEQMTCIFWNKNKSKGKTDYYYKIFLDTSKLNDAEFQIDYNMDNHALFTTDNITKDCIVYYEKMNIPDIMKFYGIDKDDGTNFINLLKNN